MTTSTAPPSPRTGSAPQGWLEPGPELTEQARGLVSSVERVVLGRRGPVALVVAAALADGHVLVEDAPGSGKTTLARTVAQALGGTFRRVQGTVDLLPADVTGSAFWRPDVGIADFVPGPVFAHVLLVDELNRTPPRTQSAFLEAMEERTVTVDGVPHPLPDPFLLVATQNPLDSAGTYPLPDGQMDRFAVRVQLGQNAAEVERAVVRARLLDATTARRRDVAAAELGTDQAPLGVERWRSLRDGVAAVHVADVCVEHAVAFVAATRDLPEVVLGASTRAAVVLVRVAQARAVLAGRDHVVPDDLKALAVPVLAHRLVLDPTTSSRAEEVVRRLVDRVPFPLP